MKKILILALLLSGFSFPVQSKTIDVFHTSDVHGAYSSRKVGNVFGDNPDRMIGGYAALASMLDKDSVPYIMLDSGDMFQGTPEGIVSKGASSILLMNKTGYSAVVPGNHDFDYGEQVLKSLVKKAKFPFLAANLYYEGTNKRPDYVKPYIIIKKSGKKIAIMGIMGRHTKTSSNPVNTVGLDIRDEAAEAAKVSKEIKEKHNPDLIIALVHWGIDGAFTSKIVEEIPDYVTMHCRSCRRLFPDANDEKYLPEGILHIARAAKDINIVLGGHNHTGILNGYHDEKSGMYFGESFTNLMFVTKTELNFNDETGKFESANLKLVPLWIDVYGENKSVLKMINGFKAQVENEMGKTVGKTAEDLSFATDGKDSKIGNWLCDVTREAVNTDIAIQNTGGIRTEIKKGDITLRDLYQTMPFDNTIVTMNITGKTLRRLIAESFKDNRAGLQISGFTVEYKYNAETGNNEYKFFDKNGNEIKDDTPLSVATNNYLASGGTYGAAFTEGTDVKDTLIIVRDVMQKSLEKDMVPPYQTGRYKHTADNSVKVAPAN